jgi:hypothetical protein
MGGQPRQHLVDLDRLDHVVHAAGLEAGHDVRGL